MDRETTAALSARPPATEELLTALAVGDWATAQQVMDDHWAEIWFGIDPADLRRLIAQAPPEILAGLEHAGYLGRVAGHGPPEDLLEPLARPSRNADPQAIAQHVADLRLRGRPVEAMSYIRRFQERARAGRSQLMDASGGADALWLVQAANTALLARDAVTAHGLLLAASATHRVDHFPFVLRDVASKKALTHAVAGDVVAAEEWNERARGLSRSGSWVEALTDDVIWLTDYLCAIDRLDPGAEELRLAKSSPLELLEFWSIALTAQVRHLVLTGRADQAVELCDAVGAADMPRPGSDGPQATALIDARALCTSPHLLGDAQREPRSVQEVLARAVGFTTAQYPAVLDLAATEAPPSADGRPAVALRLLEAQAREALGEAETGRHLLVSTLQHVHDRASFGVLRYLTAASLTAVADDPVGARTAQVVAEHGLPLLEMNVALVAPLTSAKVEVLQLLRRGLTRTEIAETSFLSVNTVKTQLASAYRKLGVTTRNAAVAAVTRLGHSLY